MLCNRPVDFGYIEIQRNGYLDAPVIVRVVESPPLLTLSDSVIEFIIEFKVLEDV